MTPTVHHPHDIVLESRTAHDNPYAVGLEADLLHESGVAIKGVPGFHNGGAQWIVRFAPSLEGRWEATVRSGDPDLDGQLSEPVVAGPNTNESIHGVLGIDPKNPYRLAWSDETPFVYLGFECDWLFSYHQAGAERCAGHLDLLIDRGFTSIVTNLYAHTGFSLRENDDTRPLAREWVFAPPRLYPFGGTNDDPDHAILNPAFFEDFDRMMVALHKRGIAVHLMLQVQNKKVNWPERRTPEDDRFWRYIVARYQAFGNIIWDVSKEAKNLHRATGSHDYVLERMEIIREADAHRHLVTVHDVMQGQAGRNASPDEAADVVTDQVHLSTTGHLNREAIRRQRLQEKPYINVEYGYERAEEQLKTYSGRTTMEWDTLLIRTWAVFAAGAYPCYYYDNTSWDLVKFEPVPASWDRYRELMDVMSALPFREMRADNNLVDSGFCLADPGSSYLVVLPEGGDLTIDLTDCEDPASISAEWIDICSGKRRSAEQSEGGRWGAFVSRFENPLDDTSTACAIVLS